MNHKIILFLVCYLGFVQISNCQSSNSDSVPAHEFRYTNPITRDTSLSMRDYCIIKVRDKWYCTGTSRSNLDRPQSGSTPAGVR